MIVADTHAVVWLLQGDTVLGKASRALIAEAQSASAFVVSAFSFWEAALLIGRGRLEYDGTGTDFRREALQLGLREIAVTGAIGIAAVGLAGLHGDPADRIIAATALTHGATLLTADRRLLDWDGPLKRHDARL